MSAPVICTLHEIELAASVMQLGQVSCGRGVTVALSSALPNQGLRHASSISRRPTFDIVVSPHIGLYRVIKIHVYYSGLGEKSSTNKL